MIFHTLLLFIWQKGFPLLSHLSFLRAGIGLKTGVFLKTKLSIQQKIKLLNEATHSATKSANSNSSSSLVSWDAVESFRQTAAISWKTKRDLNARGGNAPQRGEEGRKAPEIRRQGHDFFITQLPTFWQRLFLRPCRPFNKYFLYGFSECVVGPLRERPECGSRLV